MWIENGTYWLFTTLVDFRGNATQLWLFHASSLDGEWTSHPSNPLSADVRNSRGAGAMFRHNGALIRPSQNCSPVYGYSFTLNRIDVLSLDDYQETPGVTVDPNWMPGLTQCHSYAPKREKNRNY